MRSRLLVLAVAAAMQSAGCAGSAHPIYAAGDLITEPRLAGTWFDSSSRTVVTVAPAEAHAAYSVVARDTLGRTGTFTARLTRLGDLTVLDLYPADLPDALEEVFRAHFLRFHTIHLVEIGPERLTLHSVGNDSLAAYLTREPDAVLHVRADDMVVLTAQTPALREFLMGYLRRPGVLSETHLWRVADRP